MIFILAGGCLGLFLVVRSGHVLLPLASFYLGWRKDFYFMTDYDWAKQIRDYAGGAALGLGVILAIIPWNGLEMVELNCLLFYGGIAVALFLSTFGYRVIPQKPSWIREFEHGRSWREVELVRKRGAVLMERYPDFFPRFIRSQEGWEAWLLTII